MSTPTSTEPHSTENPNPISDWALLQRFWHYVRPYWIWGAIGLFTIPFSVAATLLLPWLIIVIIDDYVVAGQWEGLYWIVGGFGATVFVGYLADATYTSSLQRVGQLAIANMRQDLYAHTIRLKRSFFDQHPIGVILTRLTSDMEALGESLAVGVLSVFTDLIKTLALLAFLIALSWKLTLVVLLVLPPIYLCSRFLRTQLREAYNATREALAESTGFLQECLNGVKTIQLYAAESKVGQQYEQKTQRFLNAQTRSNFYDAALFSVIEGITSIAIGLMIWYGAHQILEGVVSVGVLIGFINTLNKIFVPIREFTQQISVIQRAFSAMENMEKLFREAPESEETENTPLSEADLQRLERFESLCFKEVYFRYQEQSPYVLKGVSFELKHGDRLAIVGATGSGKSTIVRLLTKAYTHYQGSITINGIELSTIPKAQIHRLIAMMQQDIYLFNESIAFNIGLQRPHISEEDIQKAAEYVYADEFIKALPEGYAFEVVDNGKNLSAGQAQLIAFARAIAGRNEVIILDEATSSVDSITEHSIQKAIEHIFQTKTVIAIAHRLSTIENSNLILVMEQGKVMEQGTHQELLQKQGLYAQLLKQLEG